MCNGRQHTTINTTVCTGVLGFLVLAAYMPFKLAILCFLGCLAGSLFLSPDLDIPNSKSQMAWGWFKWIWWGYHKAFSHRGMSHVVIIGTATRVIYFGVMAILLYYCLVLTKMLWVNFTVDAFASSFTTVAKSSGKFLVDVGRNHIREFLVFLLGVFLADTFHILGDHVCSFLKKKNILSTK